MHLCVRGQRSCICVLGESILSLSTILLFDFLGRQVGIVVYHFIREVLYIYKYSVGFHILNYHHF